MWNVKGAGLVREEGFLVGRHGLEKSGLGCAVNTNFCNVIAKINQILSLVEQLVFNICLGIMLLFS